MEQLVNYLKGRKGTQKQAAEIFGLSRSGIEKIWRSYKKVGKRVIINKKRGVQGGKKINGVQSAEVRRLIAFKISNSERISELRA